LLNDTNILRSLLTPSSGQKKKWDMEKSSADIAIGMTNTRALSEEKSEMEALPSHPGRQ
jgi:hypothetical protein